MLGGGVVGEGLDEVALAGGLVIVLGRVLDGALIFLKNE